MTQAAFADLGQFFAPRSIAVVGATEDQAKFGGRCIRQLIDFGFKGPIYPVNPRRDSIFGWRAYPSVADLPEAPDHVGLVLPAAQVPAALEQCASVGVPFVTVFSSGFAETGSVEGRALQQRVTEIAAAGKVRVMGPNCNGFINFFDATALAAAATISGPRAAPGDIGVVSHSGGAGQVNVMSRARLPC
ncbi:MAG: CoA-binding protein [Burkholderiales bacterium]|nr:MAG: CoA-binding protein [Burkholderiales bacterium]